MNHIRQMEERDVSRVTDEKVFEEDTTEYLVKLMRVK